ncbi:MAG: sodium/proton-translocating pyrophosphatase, partial [Planctomycetes bacterium]|nr:sodium/proton-translocating pyrophosphatase [Planctomycetota bacterium]
MQAMVLPTLAAIDSIPGPYWIAPIAGVAALVMAVMFNRSVLARSEGDDEMIRIAAAVRDGAMAYLKRQYMVVAAVFVALVVFLGILFMMGLQPWQTMVGVPVAGFLSGLCGWFGMRMATNASARTTEAVKKSLNEGLTVAFRSGAVMGLTVVGFALLDVSIWFFIFNAMGFPIAALTTIMLSFGMGASTQALFARVGGGIYTKAADVGADLVGKIEAGMPEDDARNPATIADNVGDNVGDVAGMGADLYESYYGSMLATMALGAAAAFTFHLSGDDAAALGIRLAAAPIALAGLGIFCSITGIFTVKARENATFAQLLKGLHKGVYIASALIMVASLGLLYMLFGTGEMGELAQGVGIKWLGLAGSIGAGLLAGLVIAVATEYYTSYEHGPTRRISEQALTGPATVIIAGIAEGMKSTWASLLTIIIAIIAAYSFAGGGENFLMGLYGVGIAAVGMLSTLGITLATDAYGPIADNAGGNAQMSDQPAYVRERTDMLDSLGNTTAATGKGFAIGSAALTALALFAAYIQVVQTQLTTQAEAFYDRGAYKAPADSQTFAVYQGHGRFAIVDTSGAEEIVSGGLLVDRTQLESDEIAQLEPGMSFPASAEDFSNARRITLDAENDFEIISTRNGLLQDVLAFYDVSLTNPRVLGGLFSGVLLAFLFCALTMQAVGRAAYAMMGECRRQFDKMRAAYRAQGMSEADIADPMKWPKRVEFEGTSYPAYATCAPTPIPG